MALTARPIDPRDITWEDHGPVFRVYLYTPPSWSAAEWELTGADITDVLVWADAHTPTGGVAEVSVVVRPDQSAELGMIRLRGRDPNASDPARGEFGSARTIAT